MMTIAVIPARYESSRFPGKPLAADTGKYLIQHVYERVAECAQIDRVIVATDDERIARAVTSFGGEAAMTRPDHSCGTDRVAEVATVIHAAAEDLVLNVQGDEPEIEVEFLSRLLRRAYGSDKRTRIWTLAAPFSDDGPKTGPGSPLDPNCVKVAIGADGSAVYFSRSLVPYPRATRGAVDRPSRWLLHLGVYAFRAGTLAEITSKRIGMSPLEESESLEQLRWLEMGLPIGVEIVDTRFVGIDTPADYAAYVARERARQHNVSQEVKHH